MSAAGRRMKQTQIIETSLGPMEYNVVDFLRAIKKRPTVYDFTSDVANDGQIRQRRLERWTEIGEELFAPFKKLPESEQTSIIFKKLKRCWKTHRRFLLKSLSAKQSGARNCKPYLFSKEMEFYVKHKSLNPNDAEEDIEREEPVVESTRKRKHHAVDDIVKLEIIDGSFTEENNNHNSKKTKVATDSTPEKISPRTTHRSERLRQRNSNIHSSTVIEPVGKAKRRQELRQDTEANEEADNTTTSVLDPMFFCRTTANGSIDQYESTQHEEISCAPSTGEVSTRLTPFVQISAMNSVVDAEADQAFFESIKPSLRKMNESKKLDFKIEVLQLVKKYQNL